MKIVNEISTQGGKGHIGDGCVATLTSNNVQVTLPPDTKIVFKEQLWENASVFTIVEGSCGWDGMEVVIAHNVRLR